MIMLARVHVIYIGKVQGVFFRANCKESASSLGLSGWVRNLSNGTVESVVEGRKDLIEAHIKWNIDHQPHARVDDIDVEWERHTGEFQGFRVL